MGIGGLIFDKNQTYEVNGEQFTFKGAGVDIAENTTVEWNVLGNPSDNLHKIGKGTLKVNLTQGNKLKVGNGTVELNAEKAFDAIYITSGKATVKLTHENALVKDDFGGIYFAKNGGTLDLNGYDFNVQKIAAADVGAHITNSNNDKKSTVRLQTTDKYIYHGTLSGNLDLDYKHATKPQNGVLVLDGGADIKGDITFENAKAVMQGHATTHAVYKSPPCPLPGFCSAPDVAINNAERPDAQKYDKGYMIENTPSSFNQPDWETRLYKFNTLNVAKSELQIGRNTIIEGNILATEATINFGGDGQIYRDNDDGSNITGEGFGFKQNVIAGHSRNDDTIVFYGDLSASHHSNIQSWMPYLEASLHIDQDSSFVSRGDATLKLRDQGIVVTNNSSVIVQDVLAEGLKSPVEIMSDESSRLTIRNVIAQDSVVEIRHADITGALAAYGSGVVDVDRWHFQDGNLQSDTKGLIRVGELDMNGFNMVDANLDVQKVLTLNSVRHEDNFYGLHANTLTLGKDSEINVNFSNESLSINNFAYDTKYTLISADKLKDERLNQAINFEIEGGIDHVTNQTVDNKIIFQFHDKPTVPTPSKPSPTDVLNAYVQSGHSGKGGAIVEAIQSHNAHSSNKYQEVALDSALNPDTLEQGVLALSQIVERTDEMFGELTHRVDRHTLLNPVRSGLNNRLASIRLSQYQKRVGHSQSDENQDVDAIIRTSQEDDQRQNFYIDFTAGMEKKDGDKSRLTATSFGYDKIIHTQSAKATVGVLASYGRANNELNGQSGDGELYMLTGYANFEAPETAGPEFLSAVSFGYFKNDRTITPEIQLGDQHFDEKHFALISSNALKYNLPLSLNHPAFSFAVRPMVLADLSYFHSKGTHSAYLKRDTINDIALDLGVGLEVDAYNPFASYSFQVTAKRNVYHSEDTVGINLSSAHGFIDYDLRDDEATHFQVNAMTTQNINDNLSFDLMLGAGADTEGRKALQGSVRVYWQFD